MMKRTKQPDKREKAPAAKWCDPREVVFAHEYLVDLDVVGAAVRSGLMKLGEVKDPDTRAELAKDIFQRPQVQNYITQLVEDRMSRAKVTADKTVREVARIAYFDPISLLREDGSFKGLHEMPAGARAAISEIKYKEVFNGKGKDEPVGRIVQVKVHDKLSSLQVLMRHLGLLGKEGNGASGGLSINYNQFNVTQNTTNNTTVQDRVDLSDFSDEEMRVLKKMVGDSDPTDVYDLVALEEQYSDSPANKEIAAA